MSFREFAISLKVPDRQELVAGSRSWESTSGMYPTPTSSPWLLLFSALRLG